MTYILVETYSQIGDYKLRILTKFNWLSEAEAFAAKHNGSIHFLNP